MFLLRSRRASLGSAVVGLSALAGLLCVAQTASANPSFARQTGFSCAQCHTQFPELTPFGRAFKAGGYTMTATKTITDEKNDRSVLEMLGMAPLGFMLQGSYTHTAKPQGTTADGPAPKNDDVLLPQQISFFYAGKIAPEVGAFVQLTYDGKGDHFGMDNTDIRFAHSMSVADKSLILGLSLNNNPTVQDLWHTTPAWGFPWASSNSAVTPNASPLIAGALAQTVAGLGAYAFWDNFVYAEFSLYHSAPLGVARPLGSGAGSNGMGTDATNVIAGVAPYWRLAVQKDFDQHSLSFGTFGMAANLYPGGANGLNGPTDKYIDTALDAQYQFITEHHIASAMATYIHENSFLNATNAAGGAAQISHQLDTFRLGAGYLWERLLGLRLNYFMTSGTSDAALYGAAALTGSQATSPSSSGLMAELSWTPWLNTKFSLQYTSYFTFNGGSSNYDGAGRNASDNNTLYAVAWLAF